ncbi:MAG: APC family permease [Acidobacteriota bacterium]
MKTDNESTRGSRPSLIRALGRWDLTALGVNQVIGSGIFVLPATVAALVGAPSSPLVWVTAALVNTLIVLCFAEAGTHFRAAGGPYLYAREAFGQFVGFEVAWMIWLTRVASQAALANAFAIYLEYFWGGATEGVGRLLVLSGVLVMLALINLRGVRQGSWTVNVFTLSKLIPLAGFIILGMSHVEWALFKGMGSPQLEGFGEGVLLLMFAFGGYELITLPAGEARAPRRQVPVALLTTIGVVSVFFLLVQVVAVGTLPALAETKTPLADAASRFLGRGGGIVIALGGLLSIGGSNAGTMLAGPRVTFALGDQRQLPAWFAHVHRRFHTPDASILVYAAVALGLALTGTFVELVAVSAVARITFYAATCAAVPVLRRRGSRLAEGFRLPGGATIPILAVATSLAVVAGASTFALAAGAVALGVGAVLFGLNRG